MDAILALIQLLFAVLFVVLGYQMAEKRNRSPVGWAIGVGMTGLLGVLILYLVGDKPTD